MADTSIAIKLHDNYSEAIRSMRETTTPFRSDVEALGGELDRLNSRKVDLKVDLQRARNELGDARKAFKTACEGTDELDQAMAKMNLAMAEADYSNIEEQLSLVAKQAKQTQKDMLEAADAISRADNKASARAASGGGEDASLLAALGKAGLFASLGQAGAGALESFVGSAYGSEVGGLFSSVLSGATTGAAMGSLVAAPVLGGVIGGVSGLVTGVTSAMESRDEAFRGVVEDQYEAIQSDLDARLSSGSGLAATRETDLIAFSKLLHGAETATDYLRDLRDLANRTPFLYQDLTAMSKSMAPAFGSDPDDMLRWIRAIGDSGASLGLGTSDMQTVGTAVSRLESTGKTTLEYLNILQERGIDAYGFLADGLGKSKEQMLEMVSKGLIPGADAARMIQEGMEGAYGGAMELQSMTFSGLTSTVEGLQQEIDAAMGEGFNQTRMPALQKQVDALGGVYGQEMQEAYRAVGTWKGNLENQRDQMVNEAMQSVLSGEGESGQAYLAAKAAGDYAEMGRLMGKAQTEGLNRYYSSAGYNELVEYQTTLARDIGQSVADTGSWRNLGYTMGQELGKGLMAYLNELMPKVSANWDVAPSVETGYNGVFDTDPASWGPGHATGLERVPYDGYRALLHKDEMVLTAGQAAARRGEAGPGGGLTIQIGEITLGGGATEEDARRVIQIMAEELAIRRQAGAFDRTGL